MPLMQFVDKTQPSSGCAYSGSILAEANASLANSPWPMFGHDPCHTGRSQYDTSANDGRKKWEFATQTYVRSSPAIGADGRVYFCSDDGYLYAVDAAGKKSWQLQLTVPSMPGAVSSPAIATDGTIYIGAADSRLYAVNPHGTKKWEFATGGCIGASPAIGADGTIYVGSEDSKLYAINPDGTKKWEFYADGEVYSSPAIAPDSTVYFGCLGSGTIYALNPDGTKKWDFATGGAIVSSPAIDSDGTIYVGSEDYRLYAIDPDGTKRWEFNTGYQVWSSPAIAADGTIYIGSGTPLGPYGKLYAINPDGTKKWEFATGGAVESSPAIGADGTVYIGSWDYKLYAIAPDGTKKWGFATGGPVVSSPAIDADGTIYVGSLDRRLYAIGGHITVTSPSIGTVWMSEITYTITWTTDTTVSPNVRIEYFYESYSNAATISSNTANDGDYSWTIPTNFQVGKNCIIRIADLSNPSIYDDSDPFEIRLSPKSLRVTSPCSESIWMSQSTYTIAWTTDGTVGPYVEIKYYYESYSTAVTISSNTTNDGNYSWTVPSGIAPRSAYVIRITDLSNVSVYDDSDQFTIQIISILPGTIAVTSPSAGAVWTSGSTHSITWTTAGAVGSSVKIELYYGSYYSSALTIDASTANDGNHSWSVPSDIAPRSDYVIRITDLGNMSIYCDSGIFEIKAPSGPSRPADTSEWLLPAVIVLIVIAAAATVVVLLRRRMTSGK
ncbi:MAG: PQQ-binding-like beta-propeller repeat protein [Thermoplasmatota archaeon]|nr:PQQ-binding-like beta-propeller repeat protein [Candidatus Thermoplasmatota archaeon]